MDHSSSASSMTARSGSAPSARSLGGPKLARATSFGEFTEADEGVEDAGDDGALPPASASASASASAAAGGFRASSAGPRPSFEGGGAAPARAMHHAATSPPGSMRAASQRPGTALGAGAESERRALRPHNKSFAGGDGGVLGISGRSRDEHGALATVREEEGGAFGGGAGGGAGGTGGMTSRPSSASAHWHEGILLSRGGLLRPKSAYVFSMTQRPATGVGGGATVPFHFVPPPLLARDPTTEVKNVPRVPFPLSTRDQWQAVHMAVTSSPDAGPGSYDCNVDFMSTKRISRTQSFTLAKRQLGAAVAAGPAPYSIGDSTLKSFYPRMPGAVMAVAGRPSDRPLPATPGPVAVSFIQKHRPFIAFSTAPGHDVPSGDLVTAAIPIRDAHRVRKHKPMPRFSSAPRFGGTASTF
jgi:hypothetical protein